MRAPNDPVARRRDPIRAVGESYRDACDRLAGEKRAAEIDRDAAQAEVARLRAKYEDGETP